MLDLKFVRENPDIVKQNIKNKFQDHKLPLVDEVIELDEKNRKIKQEVEETIKNKNQEMASFVNQEDFFAYTGCKASHKMLCYRQAHF